MKEPLLQAFSSGTIDSVTSTIRAKGGMILSDGFVHGNILSDKVGVFDGLQDVILNQKAESRN